MSADAICDQGDAVAASGARSGGRGVFLGVALAVALWIGFVHVAGRFAGADAGVDAALHDAVLAELAGRRCPGLRLDPASFRDLARERGIGHADLYQRRSARLQKAADHLDRRLRADPDGECARMLDRYGGAGPAPRLLTRT